MLDCKLLSEVKLTAGVKDDNKKVWSSCEPPPGTINDIGPSGECVPVCLPLVGDLLRSRGLLVPFLCSVDFLDC